MTRIPVEKVHGANGSRITEEAQILTDQIRQLAFHLFETRGYADGHDLDDWLTAERQLLMKPETEVLKKDDRFEIRIQVAGCSPGEIHVTALPASLVIQARAQGNQVLRETIDLPATIDVDKTVARVDKGVVYVTAIRQRAHALA